MDSQRLRQQIETHAEEIRRLHARIRETFARKTKGTSERKAWEEACAAFHARYDALTFPGGCATAKERVLQGDPEAVEAALCFVEVRPYFFRSGYLFQTLLRALRQAPLTAAQRARYENVAARYRAWKEARRKTLAGDRPQVS